MLSLPDVQSSATVAAASEKEALAAEAALRMYSEDVGNESSSVVSLSSFCEEVRCILLRFPVPVDTVVLVVVVPLAELGRVWSAESGVPVGTADGIVMSRSGFVALYVGTE